MKKWILAWAGAPVLGVANGVARERLYVDALGEDAANAVSTGALLSLLAGYMCVLQRRWPLRSQREALSVGAAWASLTVAFEFGFGHWVAGDSWSELLKNYDLTAGKLWPLVPTAMFVGPELARQLAGRPHDGMGNGAMPGPTRTTSSVA